VALSSTAAPSATAHWATGKRRRNTSARPGSAHSTSANALGLPSATAKAVIRPVAAATAMPTTASTA